MQRRKGDCRTEPDPVISRADTSGESGQVIIFDKRGIYRRHVINANNTKGAISDRES